MVVCANIETRVSFSSMGRAVMTMRKATLLFLVAAYSRDGNRIVRSRHDSTIKIWEA